MGLTCADTIRHQDMKIKGGTVAPLKHAWKLKKEKQANNPAFID